MEKPKESQACAEISRRPVIVHVNILSDAGDGQFELSTTDLPPVKHVKHGGKLVPMLTFDNNQGGAWSDGFRVTFKLHDDTGNGYGFYVDPDTSPPDPNDAIWVKCIDPKGFCPKNRQSWDGFMPVDVTDNRKTLTVENPNDGLQYFGFALLFSRDGESKPSLIFDPVGDDRNGQAN